MIKVSIAKLKNELSHHLQEARKGGEILITDRDKPLAKIIPIDRSLTKSDDEVLALLVDSGSASLDFAADPITSYQPLKLSKRNLASKYLEEDRNG